MELLKYRGQGLGPHIPSLSSLYFHGVYNFGVNEEGGAEGSGSDGRNPSPGRFGGIMMTILLCSILGGCVIRSCLERKCSHNSIQETYSQGCRF